MDATPTPVAPMPFKSSFIRVDPAVAKLFCVLLQPVIRSQLYSNRMDDCVSSMKEFLNRNLRVTGLTSKGAVTEELKSYWGSKEVSTLETQTPEFYQVRDKFHFGFAVFPFELDWQNTIPEEERDERQQVKHKMVQDRLLLWKCSEGEQDRMAPAHLIGLEGLMHSVICGGFFASVVPKRWIGKKMKYMGWWQDHAAPVARIRLPSSAVTAYVDGKNGPDGKPLELAAPGEWELCIWQRPFTWNDEIGSLCPSSKSNASKLQFAEYRYSPFIFPVESLSDESIDKCMTTFLQHDWWNNSAKFFRAMVEKNSTNSWCGTSSYLPHGVEEQKEVWFFEPDKSHQYGIKRVDTTAEIAQDKMAVQIKPGTTIKLSVYNKASVGALLDMRYSKGVKHISARKSRSGSEHGEMVFELAESLKRKSFSDVREELVSLLCDRGLVPYMTNADWQRMVRQERWLSIQLTPNERWVEVKPPVYGEPEDGKEIGPLLEEGKWELLYEDMGMQATHPDLMVMWDNRAKSMGINKILLEFQYGDALRMAAKQCQLNTNVMGLGKTLTTLFAFLLRGGKHMLIVVPGKLTGVWQDEIQSHVVPFCRRQKRNWQGEILDPTVQVIEWAKDCLPQNLKTFNIISYDKLKSTPRDGQFFKCPRCGMIAYSAFQTEPIACPGDPSQDESRRCSHVIKRWNELNRRDYETMKRGRRKFRVLCDLEGNPMKYPNGDYMKVHFTKLTFINQDGHGSEEVSSDGNATEQLELGIPTEASTVDKMPQKFPVERTKIIDERPPRPSVPMMIPVDNMYDKTKRMQIGIQVNESTGEERPIYKQVKRPCLHVKWTFSEVLRWSFNHLAADELLYIKNEDSQRTQAITHLCGTSRWGLTGTPMKGMPQNILPLVNWVLRRIVFPNYRSYDPQGMGRFMTKYESTVKIGGVLQPNGVMIGGKKKQIPRVNNAELFQAEMSPHMIRHTRNEPIVEKDIPKKTVLSKEIEVPMDECHREFYQKFLNLFSEWWIEMKRDKDKKEVAAGELMVKMLYLRMASSIPHHVFDNILKGDDPEGKEWARMIGPYKGPNTQKMLLARKMIKSAVAQGDKTLVFSYLTKNSDMGHAWATKVGLNSMIVDGRVSLTTKKGETRSQRHKLVSDFCNQPYHVMWAGLTAMAEGMNIPQANHGIVLDVDWEPSLRKQAIGRMLRMQQTKTIYDTMIIHEGTIDGYMAAWCLLKARGGDEAIDYMEFSDFTVGMIPDISQYADWIVDGTEGKEKAKMWAAVEHIRKKAKEEGETL